MTSYDTSVPFEIDDKNMNNKGFEPKFTTINRITTGLARIEHARGFLESATLSENWVQEMGSLKIKTADLPGGLSGSLCRFSCHWQRINILSSGIWQKSRLNLNWFLKDDMSLYKHKTGYRGRART